MKDHMFILALFLALAVLIAVVFWVVYRSSNPKGGEEKSIQNPTGKRFIIFLLYTGVMVILLFMTIPKSPYYAFAKDSPAKVIHVSAMQYMFMMSSQAINPDAPTMDPEIILPVNEVVEFRVTSSDVTHGFGIYNSKAQLVTQTQAMPQYINRLRYKFTEPGEYTILCLEFCGAGHAVMRSSFTVK